jgi:adenylate cyclase
MADEGFKRKLAAILSADVIGYSRLMRDNEEATVRDIAAHRVLISEIMQQYHGRVVDSPGDNILAEFASVVDAVNGAIKIQAEIKKSNADTPADRRMEFRIGINLGDLIEEEDRIYGDGVNIAARVEGLASAGGIAISETVFEHIKDKLSLGYHYLGEQTVKNIPEPVRVYRLLTEPGDAGKLIGVAKKAPKGRWLEVAAVIFFVVIGLIIYQFYMRRPAIEPAAVEKMAYPLPDKPSIAVLPFDNMSGDPEQEYISDGFTEQIIASLSMVPEVFVIARNSTFTYKDRAVKVQQVAEDLGVQYILEGSIQKEGQRVRITAQLIDAISGRHLWAERYDRELKDIFALQDEITLRIITELRVKLTAGEQARLLYKGTENLQAYLKYLQALEYFRLQTKENNALARRLFEEAIAIDPKFPQAYTLLGATYWMDLYLDPSKSPKLLLKKAFELNEKAIALNDSLPTSHSHMGWLYALAGKHDDAIAECEKAIFLDPNSSDAHLWMGYALRYAGRHEEAVRSSEHALRLNPIPPNTYYRSLGLTYIFVGRYEEAIEVFNKAIGQSPNDLLTHFSLACVYSLAGRNEDAQAEAEKVLQINPNFSLEQFAKRFTYKNKADKELIVGAASKAGLPHTPPQ